MKKTLSIIILIFVSVNVYSQSIYNYNNILIRSKGDIYNIETGLVKIFRSMGFNVDNRLRNSIPTLECSYYYDYQSPGTSSLTIYLVNKFGHTIYTVSGYGCTFLGGAKGDFKLCLKDIAKKMKNLNYHYIEDPNIEKVNRLANNESEINELIKKSSDIHSGIYEEIDKIDGLKLAFVNNEHDINLLYINEIDNRYSWECGEIKAVLKRTADDSIYKTIWYTDSRDSVSAIITFEGYKMKIKRGNYEQVFIKMLEDNDEK